MKPTKSDYFLMKGGGITNEAEIKDILEFLVSKGVFVKSTESGQDAYMEAPGVSKEALEAALNDYEEQPH